MFTSSKFMVPHAPRRATSTSGVLHWLAMALSLSAVACDEKTPTAPAAAEPQFALSNTSAAGDVPVAGTIPLPVNQTFNGGLAFGITQTGTGRAGLFRINNASSTSSTFDILSNGQGPALKVIRSGAGSAATFQSTNANALEPAVDIEGAGKGHALFIDWGSDTHNQPAIEVEYTGRASAATFVGFSDGATNGTISALALGNGPAGRFQSSSRTGVGIKAETEGGTAGVFTSLSSGIGVQVQTRGGTAGTFSNSGSGRGILVRNSGTDWAGEFIGTARGVRIQTAPFTAGLQVVGGSKNAVVGTATGARALYSEESTEVWFADYGFGKLTNGRARILIDPGFAQTVSLEEPYHVFVQPYGNAELYIEETTTLGFVVRLREGDPNAKFGYRIVAKRSGFESQRLEAAQWADNIAGF